MRSLYLANVWIPAEQATGIIAAGRHFLSGYQRLSWLSTQLAEPRFACMPKLHMLWHIHHTMVTQCGAAGHCENPTTQGCASDEDFIGRFCYLTRCTSPRSRITRSIERYLCQIRLIWLRAQQAPAKRKRGGIQV